ncbi:MAG TPA: branched-chain amino acid ABC transporter permease [Thermomicrobiales bacterium]|jgi:branched-chain amino acid transport system permease protein|nr:branched-chain amino acid ABC transporter permease [Thermomicrobiales bacterium]
MRFWVFQTLNGLTTGALLFFLASGLTVIFGLMRILNLAHGALFLFGGYVGYTVAERTGSFVLAVLAGAFAAAVLGVLIQQGFSTSLLRSPFNQVLLTLGLAFIISNAILYFWGGTPKLLRPPEPLRGSREILGVFYPQYRLMLIALSCVTAVILYLVWERSRLGAIVRACVDDREMAAAMGIRVDLVFAAVFAIGAALAGMTGVLGAPVLGLSIGLEFDVLLLAVVVVVVGGIGSLSGAFIASMAVGLIDAYGKARFPELSYFTLFVPVILILLVRPRGLLGRTTVG